MKEMQPLENLSTPAPQHFNFHHLETLQISKRKQIIVFIYQHTTTTKCKNTLLHYINTVFKYIFKDILIQIQHVIYYMYKYLQLLISIML